MSSAPSSLSSDGAVPRNTSNEGFSPMGYVASQSHRRGVLPSSGSTRAAILQRLMGPRTPAPSAVAAAAAATPPPPSRTYDPPPPPGASNSQSTAPTAAGPSAPPPPGTSAPPPGTEFTEDVLRQLYAFAAQRWVLQHFRLQRLSLCAGNNFTYALPWGTPGLRDFTNHVLHPLYARYNGVWVLFFHSLYQSGTGASMRT